MPAAAPAAQVTSRGLRVPEAAMTDYVGGPARLRRLLGALTVVEKQFPGGTNFARKRRSAWQVADRGLYIPRARGELFIRKRMFSEIVPDPAPPPVRQVAYGPPAQPFYDYQAAAADHICRPGGPLATCGAAYLQMDTGMGKTRFGIAAAAQNGGPVFVVAPTESIRQQWLDEFKAVFPNLRCGSYVNPPRGSRKIPPGPETHDAVVGIINTVRAKNDGFFAGYGTVILDEAHEMHSPKNMGVLWLAQGVPAMIGISATPDDRKDGLDKVVYHFLGNPIRAATDIPGFDVADVCFRGRVREVEYKGDPDYCEAVLSAAGTVSAIETVGNIIRDPARLRLVAAEVIRLCNLDAPELGLGPRPPAAATEKHPAGEVRRHGVFVFAEHRDYLPMLQEALLRHFRPEEVEVPELAPVPPAKEKDVPAAAKEKDAPPTTEEKNAPAAEEKDAPPAAEEKDTPAVQLLRGGATRQDMSRARQVRIVLTTYGYSRRGVSLVDMTAILLATPRRNGMRQILGRVTRRGSDESIIRQVVDIKDISSALKGQSTDRRRVYKEKNYPIYRVRTAHTDYAEDGTPALEGEDLVWAPDIPEEKQADELDSGDVFD